MSAYPPWTAAGGDPLGRKRAFGEVEDPAAVEMGAEDGRGKRVSSGMGGGEQGLAELGQAGVGQQQQQQLYQHPPAYHQQSNAPPAPDSFGQTQPQLSTLASPSFPAPSLPHQSYPWHPQPLQRPTLPHASASFPAQYHPDSRSHSPASFAAAPSQSQQPPTYQVNIHQHLAVPPPPPAPQPASPHPLSHAQQAQYFPTPSTSTSQRATSAAPSLPSTAVGFGGVTGSWMSQRLEAGQGQGGTYGQQQQGWHQQQHEARPAMVGRANTAPQQASQAQAGEAAAAGTGYRYPPPLPSYHPTTYASTSADHLQQQSLAVPPVPSTSTSTSASYYPVPTTAGGAMYPSHALQTGGYDYGQVAGQYAQANEQEFPRRLAALRAQTSPFQYNVPLVGAPSYPPPPPQQQQPYPSPASTHFPYSHLAASPSSSSSSTHSTPATATGLPILPQTLPALQQASTERALHRARPPVLAFNPAREPASGHKQKVHTAYGVTYAVSSSGTSKGKAKSAELSATCWTCSLVRAKIILRGHDLTGWTPRLSFTCLDCLPVEEQGREVDPDGDERRERLAQRAYEADQDDARRADGSSPTNVSVAQVGGMGLPAPTEHDRATFEDTFSGAVDALEGGPAAAARGTLTSAADPSSAPSTSTSAATATATSQHSRLLLPPEETSRGLSDTIKRQALTCDVCDRVIGAGNVTTLAPQDSTPPPFTVEVICRTCEEKYKPCSDCGGGGGRLTPGRWRCKELFPAGRRTCTLSHARNPPLSDIDYDVLRITEIDSAKLDALEARCRLVYWNTRLRTQARPEMLERGDGLATTYAQCEKLTVDGWSLLKPMMSVDVEATRGFRRYISLQTSTPHRRRAKPKPGAPPKPEPVEQQDPVEKEVSGFLLVEHDMRNGAIFIAVTMPWAISGDAFDATTILIDETIKRIKTDIRHENAIRREHRQELLPEPWCLWGVTPFKADSRMSQSLTRRSFVFLEEYLKEHPDLDLSIFPPQRPIHIPNEFVKTFKIFLRDVTDDDGGEGGPPPPADAKRQPKQRARKLKATQR
ncbi:hypothetical protein NBRC10512_004714 [Rhodotorula toruloides]|uniref:RHTO0S09e00408g1_1 n=2 Tax=Rhodotorula toruloides TaxID=5286 RepID=A0A061B2V8_RHOTO|nr:uncharacterized protein RHTO_07912 [Rhodotorula toruloides NP11]EMS23041.1 hypothetical protein RHTO_07912 [Rhodotorula toruloides NP11]CDR44137.1 RHTO0S09e00408g1_1 [Rhodotorula toruloides]